MFNLRLAGELPYIDGRPVLIPEEAVEDYINRHLTRKRQEAPPKPKPDELTMVVQRARMLARQLKAEKPDVAQQLVQGFRAQQRRR